MGDPVETTVDVHSVELRGGVFADELLTFAGEASYPEGTVLARDSGTGKLVPFDPDDGGGVNHEIPKAVLPYAVSKGEAGDLAIRALIAGVVNKDLLVDEDGEDITTTAADQLRDYGIVPVSVEELGQ